MLTRTDIYVLMLNYLVALLLAFTVGALLVIFLEG